MKNCLLLFCTLFVSGGVLTAMAGISLPSHQDLQAMFRAIDTSGNEAIDSREWRAASAKLFDLTDTNHDGVLDPAELAVNSRLRDAYPTVGTIREGGISRQAFLATRAAMFRSGDIDHNDYITYVEYEILVVLRRTGWNDRNGNDRIDMSELRTVLATAFPQLDTDHDGALTLDESGFLAPLHREEMDAEHSGRITFEQLLNGYRWLLGADAANKNRL